MCKFLENYFQEKFSKFSKTKSQVTQDEQLAKFINTKSCLKPKIVDNLGYYFMFVPSVL